jgi:hypothetical protein
LTRIRCQPASSPTDRRDCSRTTSTVASEASPSRAFTRAIAIALGRFQPDAGERHEAAQFRQRLRHVALAARS